MKIANQYRLGESTEIFYNGQEEVVFRKGVWNYEEAVLDISQFDDDTGEAILAVFREISEGKAVSTDDLFSRFKIDSGEAEPIAMALCGRGFHACVLRYPCAPARFPAALCALAEAVAWVRAGAAENHVDPRQISVCGFSAGGHLAGSLGVFWNAPFLAAETGLVPQDMRPDKMVLCYPVITGGEFAHKGSFDNLLGADADAARRAEVSLEQHVTQDTPPAFLWHTYTDPGVPVENTMLFAMALRRAGVPFESHIYSVGGHGLSLANELTENTAGAGVQAECTGWVDLAAGWLRR